MGTPNDNKRQQLISKPKELFQLDQPDLDFGLYRIMHAKSAEITSMNWPAAKVPIRGDANGPLQPSAVVCLRAARKKPSPRIRRRWS
jgi:adenine-specific DNA-methyltransferase